MVEGIDDTVWGLRRMKENPDGNLKCVEPITTGVQDDVRNGGFPLLQYKLRRYNEQQTHNLQQMCWTQSLLCLLPGLVLGIVLATLIHIHL